MASSVPSNQSDKPKSTYGKVVLTMENCVLPPDKLFPTPSSSDGLNQESETDLRILGCELIQTSGILLRLPQVLMATGQILFQRFYYSQSFVRHHMEVVAMACVTLASKIEESPRKIRDVINVFHHIKQMRAGKIIQPLILNQNYVNYKDQVIKAERRVLKELGFCVHVKHPHKFIITLLQILEVKNHDVLQTAWNYMNDSLRSGVFLLYQPEIIACACIHLSANLLQIPLPRNPAWYLVFGACEGDIHSVCHIILSLYTREKPDWAKLDKMVEQLRKAREEAKLKAKALSSMSSDSEKNHSLSSIASSSKNAKFSSIESLKENNIKKKVSKPDRESRHRKKGYSCDGDVSSYIRKRGKSSSTDCASSQSSCSSRHKHKSPSRSYKKTRRSLSRSKTRETKLSKHRSSHQKKVNYIYSCSPHKHTSKKDKIQDGDGSCIKKCGSSTSADSVSSQSSCSSRHRHKSPSRSHKKSRRYRSRSKTREPKQSKHSSPKKVNHTYNCSPHKHTSRKGKNLDKSPYRSTSRRHSSNKKHKR